MLARILVPTDFSEIARNAAIHAIELAKKADASLHFLHVIPSPTLSDTFLAVETTSVIRQSSRQLEKWYSDLIRGSSLSCEGHSRIGDITTQIIKVIEDRNVDLIIMGTQGAHGLKRLFMGSQALSVIKRAPCPVLVVPEGASLHGWKKIIYATDYENSDVEALTQVAELAKIFGSEIEVVHVSEDDSRTETELSVIDYFSDIVRKAVSYPNLSFKIFKNDRTVDGIEQYVNSAKADLLVLCARRKTVIQRLFRKSLTKEIAFHGNTPLLCFHAENGTLSDEHRQTREITTDLF